MKWSQKTKTFTTCRDLSSSIVISMPVTSTWSSSKGEVTRIVCSGAFTWVPLCWIHLSQPLIAFCICIAMLGHQNWSHNRDSVWHWPWCPASYGTCSWLPLDEPWGLKTAELLPALWPEYGGGRGHPDGVWISSSPSGWPWSLPSWCVLPEDIWDPAPYGRKSTSSQFLV